MRSEKVEIMGLKKELRQLKKRELNEGESDNEDEDEEEDEYNNDSEEDRILVEENVTKKPVLQDQQAIPQNDK